MISSLNYDEKTLPERAADQITDMIVDGTFKPGDRLPTELELAEKMNVGRSTVREAIKVLVSQNIIEVRRGNGTFVKDQVGVMDDPLGFRFVQDKLKLGLDLCEIRMIIEPNIAAMAAQRASKKDIEDLEEACINVENLIAKGENHHEWDVNFHTVLAKCTGNSVVNTLTPIITQAVPFFIDITKKSLLQQTIVCHREILNAVIRHDSKAAFEACKRHLEDNKNNMIALNKLDDSIQ